MKTKIIFLICGTLLASCMRFERVEVNPNLWHRHCAGLLNEYLVCYRLPANEFVTISYRKIIKIPPKQDESMTLFSVDYDFPSYDWVLSEFQIDMILKPINSESGNAITNFEEFRNILMTDLRTSDYSGVAIKVDKDDFNVTMLGNVKYLSRKADGLIAYYILLNNKYYIEIRGLFFNNVNGVENVNQENKIKNIAVFKKMVEQVRVTDYRGEKLQTINFVSEENK